MRDGLKQFILSLGIIAIVSGLVAIIRNNNITNRANKAATETEFYYSVRREDLEGVYQLSKIETKARAVQFENSIRYDAVRGRLVDIRYTSLIEATELAESPWNYNPRKLDDVCSGR